MKKYPKSQRKWFLFVNFWAYGGVSVLALILLILFSRWIRLIYILRSQSSPSKSYLFSILCTENFKNIDSGTNYAKQWHNWFPKKLTKFILVCVGTAKSKVRIRRDLSGIFNISDGLNQGDALSPLLKKK